MTAETKRLITAIGCKNKQAILLGTDGDLLKPQATLKASLITVAEQINNSGADELLILDLSENDEEHEAVIGSIKETARVIDLPILVGGRVKRMEDVKKYLYAGAKAVFLDADKPENVDLIREVSNRFGAEKIFMMVSDEKALARAEEFAQLGVSMLILNGAVAESADAGKAENLPALAVCTKTAETETVYHVLHADHCEGVILTAIEADKTNKEISYMELKQELSKKGCPMDILTSSVPWSDFKLGPNGLIPVIVQDFKTDEVLMLAYMNEQAFEDTLKTGKMHYYSRSRQTQWMKGETSGHLQYVKSLKLDCDNDTILAKVHQIGPACHTGSHNCFFQTLAEKDYKETNPLKVFEDVYAVIKDRKIHPKEGSYTNYLFDKGIDKILKKVGEECTEIVIAAKNPDPEEIKYEISDFLYHAMVLMVQKGVTWEEITEELANR